MILIYSVLIALCYAGRELQNSFYMYARDLLILVLSVTIYGYGGYLFYKATKIFQKASLQFNMEWNTTAYTLHLVVVVVEVLASSIWAIGFCISSAYMARNAYEARQIELGFFCVYLAGHDVVLAAILLNVALSQGTADVSDGLDNRPSLRKSCLRDESYD